MKKILLAGALALLSLHLNMPAAHADQNDDQNSFDVTAEATDAATADSADLRDQPKYPPPPNYPPPHYPGPPPKYPPPPPGPGYPPPPPGPGYPPPPPPPHYPPPHSNNIVCYARNQYNQWFSAVSSNANWAQRKALERCGRVSQYCYAQGCRYLN